MKSVAIVGVGLIGGSFALALRRAGYRGRILGVSSGSTVTEAIRLGVIDQGVDAAEAAATADLLYLARPINGILETINWLANRIRPETLVTDAGSTKLEIVEHAARTLGAAAFLGGHPMAGKELRGVGAAEAELFEGRTYFFCPHDPAVLDHPIACQLLDYVGDFGAKPILIPAADHDRLVGLTSHLPQLASTALASCLAQNLGAEKAKDGAGPGLVDMTRLAQSSYDLWADILSTNVTAIDLVLGLYIKELQEIRAALGVGSVANIFERADKFSRIIRKPRA